MRAVKSHRFVYQSKWKEKKKSINEDGLFVSSDYLLDIPLVSHGRYMDFMTSAFVNMDQSMFGDIALIYSTI